MSLLEIVKVTKGYPYREQLFKKEQLNNVVSNVSLSIKEASCLAIVGESGSGKSTLGKIIVGLERQDQGQILLNGKDVDNLTVKERMIYRHSIQMVFQDPYSSLNPKLTIMDSVSEPLKNDKTISRKQRESIVKLVIDEVGLSATTLTRHPHQLSGGQLQRVNIARTISTKPRVIVLDEVVSSLDVLNQVRVLDLLKSLQKSYGMSYIFISHDLQAVNYIATEMVVMEQGSIVEHIDNMKNIRKLTHPASLRLRAATLTISTGGKHDRN